jgi:uncharacterized protein YutE (UPF0331/DUF86 family)
VTDPVLVLQKLTTLRDHAERVRRRRPPTPDMLRADVDLQDAMAMSLLVAVQEAIDIAFHIAADEGWGIPASHADSFATLARRGVIDDALADALARAVSVRNRLAHGYGSLDLDRIWSELPAGLEALDRYAVAIARFLPPAAG